MKRQKKLAKPISMQILHEEVRDGIRVRVYASWKLLIFRVYVAPEPGKCVQLVMDHEKFMEYNLDDLIEQAIKESIDLLPADISLAPGV